jgi:dTDP-4-dehydrorhamnose 3,5-epimerase
MIMINGVITKPIKKFLDERGWLAEVFRDDQLEGIPRPAMSYISVTVPGVARGPHEHVQQTDYFCFLGPSNFKVVLWDNRKDSSTFGEKMTLFAGMDNPMMVIVPPGIVHGYKNIGTETGMVVNFPDKLYRGVNYKEPVDEIRHENEANTKFTME